MCDRIPVEAEVHRVSRLHTACWGHHESKTTSASNASRILGTDNEELLGSPFYVGARHRRVRGEDYRDLLEETLEASAPSIGPATTVP